MPFYEFYCPDCHTLMRFFSRRVNTETRPACPHCTRAALERRPSLFGISKGRGESAEGGEDDALAGMDEARMATAMAGMDAEFSNLDENDPKAMSRAMRRLFEGAGLKLGAGMREALARMESGEDADSIEAELGDALEREDPFAAQALGRGGLRDLRNRLLPPRIDERLYEL
jgi:putative FmdB family regulatory protein